MQMTLALSSAVHGLCVKDISSCSCQGLVRVEKFTRTLVFTECWWSLGLATVGYKHLRVQGALLKPSFALKLCAYQKR